MYDLPILEELRLMLDYLIYALCFFGALAAMEGVAYFTHKYVMHGFGWFLHESHHRERNGPFELNDLYALIFAAPSIVLIWLGSNGHPWALWTGLGIAGYGLIYFGFHDVIVHRRIHHDWRPKRWPYLQRIIHAHRLHHACEEKEGAVSFGFVWAPPVAKLRDEMRAIEAARGRSHFNRRLVRGGRVPAPEGPLPDGSDARIVPLNARGPMGG